MASPEAAATTRSESLFAEAQRYVAALGGGERVLELAHGTGNLQLDLHAAGYTSIGYDLSPYMGRIARRKMRDNGITPHLARGMAQALPFDSLYFYGAERPIHVSYGPQHKRAIWTFTAQGTPTRRGIEHWLDR